MRSASSSVAPYLIRPGSDGKTSGFAQSSRKLDYASPERYAQDRSGAAVLGASVLVAAGSGMDQRERDVTEAMLAQRTARRNMLAIQ